MESNNEERLGRIERKLDVIQRMLRVLMDREYEDEGDGDRGVGAGQWKAAMPTLTTRQHVVAQMLTRGATNQEIAERMGITVNTAKVHVRSIGRKLGTGKRSEIGERVGQWLGGLEDTEYRRLSGGLPLNWDAEWREPDPYAALYRADASRDGEADLENDDDG